MIHTFLLKEGFWVAEGEYYNEYGNAYSVVGQLETTHRNEVWIEDRVIKVFFDEPVALASRLEIEPIGAGMTSTGWTSRNRILGNLKGRIVIVRDSIMSLFRSQEGRYFGSEWLQEVGEDTYQSRRILLVGDRVLSSWVMEMRKAG